MLHTISAGPLRRAIRDNELAVPSMLGSPRNRPGALLADLGLELVVGAAGMDIDGLRRPGHMALRQPVGRDELPFSLVPRLQNLSGWGAAQDAGVNCLGQQAARWAQDCRPGHLLSPANFTPGMCREVQ